MRKFRQRELRSNNSTGKRGVVLNKKTGKYMAWIQDNGRRYYLGEYDDLATAGKAYDNAEILLAQGYTL